MRTLSLTTRQVIAAVQELEGQELNQRTLAAWAHMEIAVPSVVWERKRGRYSARVYSLDDLARIRLVVRLRKAGFSMTRVRAVLAYLSRELPEVLKPKTQAVLIVEGWRAAIVRRAGSGDLEIPSGQYRLSLAEVIKGNIEAAREALKVA
ncbi:MAG TPA: MerR family transcriptional regulator [Candidatus Binatia bacterium]|jgi:DNA-binding transcriptional MerR regulator|nr:MerR family transcriptional regulator [Candidatus Binatia bacterium]